MESTYNNEMQALAVLPNVKTPIAMGQLQLCTCTQPSRKRSRNVNFPRQRSRIHDAHAYRSNHKSRVTTLPQIDSNAGTILVDLILTCYIYH